MAGGVSGYAAINAKVRILYASLLGPAGLAGLKEAADLVALVGMLRNTPYAKYLDDTNAGMVSPRAVEGRLRHGLVAHYRSVLDGAPVQARRMVTGLYRQYEVNNLKAVLRAIATGASPEGEGSLWERVHELLLPISSSAGIPIDSMAQAGSVAAAVELLRGTSYYGVLSSALKRYSSEQSLFPLEVALDLHYWRQLWHEVRALPGQDQVHALRVIGSLVDMHNLLWAIRYRIYHHLSEEELINYTLPFGYRVRDSDIRTVAAGGEIAPVVERAFPDVRDAQTLLVDPKDGLPVLEMELKRYVARQCVAAFLGDPFHIGVALAYLVLLDLEIQDLTVLIEAKGSKISMEQYSPYLTWSVAAQA